MNISNKYLVHNDMHIIKIKTLDTQGIKDSSKKFHKDKAKISRVGVLNHIVKTLTGRENFCFNDYDKYYQSEIVPFLKKHGLVKQVDLLTPKQKEDKSVFIPFPVISAQNLSERLFFGSKNNPTKFFSGYNFDFKNTFNDGHHVFSDLFIRESDRKSFGLIEKSSEEAIRHNIRLAQENPNQLIPVEGFQDRKLIDIVIGSIDMYDLYNTMGDILFLPEEKEVVPTLYWASGSDVEKREKQRNFIDFKAFVFKQRIIESDSGWVEIIPFSNNLIFLKGADGKFDFLFKNQRDQIFKYNVFNNALKSADIPTSFNDKQYFHRWKYFVYQGWREKDSHEAENLFYKQGGLSHKHPGTGTIEQNYYTEKGLYTPPQHQANYCDARFTPVYINGKCMAISNPISISDFEEFISERPNFMDERIGEPFIPSNTEKDKTLPVTVNFYDVVFFSKWFQEKYQLPVRLLECSEYTDLRKDSQQQMQQALRPNTMREELKKLFKEQGLPFSEYNEISDYHSDDLMYYDSDNSLYVNHPPTMSWEKFDNLVCKFNPEINQNFLAKGLSFCASNCFAEWTKEMTCIRSASLNGFRNNERVLGMTSPLKSTGKYKHLKIGFRLCYELDLPNDSEE
ncbi:MAG: hypothetical protein FE834_06755 [Gammaproteobacteria bacterium]|nr:hypothetical protein [Gammaproteobacteria bacterium]